MAKETISVKAFGALEQAVKDLPEKIADKILPLHHELKDQGKDFREHKKDDKDHAVDDMAWKKAMDDTVGEIKADLAKQNNWWTIAKFLFFQVFISALMAVLIGVTIAFLNRNLNITFFSYMESPYNDFL